MIGYFKFECVHRRRPMFAYMLWSNDECVLCKYEAGRGVKVYRGQTCGIARCESLQGGLSMVRFA